MSVLEDCSAHEDVHPVSSASPSPVSTLPAQSASALGSVPVHCTGAAGSFAEEVAFPASIPANSADADFFSC